MLVRKGMIALLAVVSPLAPSALAFDLVNQSDGIGLRGFDPVAYFSDHRAVRGDPGILLLHNGVKYEFASERNRAMFLANPDAYLPQYGGFCAYAVAEERLKVDVDPHAFAIVGGKLYLNFSEEVRNEFAKKAQTDIPKGDANWVEVSKQTDVIR